MNKIKQISAKGDQITVKFSSDEKNCDAVFPKKDSPIVLPATSFMDALDRFSGLAQSTAMLSTEVEWRLKSINVLWDKEGNEYGWDASLSAYSNEESLGMSISLRQDSPDSVKPVLQSALEKLLAEASAFVEGKSAQSSLNLSIAA